MGLIIFLKVGVIEFLIKIPHHVTINHNDVVVSYFITLVVEACEPYDSPIFFFRVYDFTGKGLVVVIGQGKRWIEKRSVQFWLSQVSGMILIGLRVGSVLEER